MSQTIYVILLLICTYRIGYKMGEEKLKRKHKRRKRVGVRAKRFYYF